MITSYTKDIVIHQCRTKAGIVHGTFIYEQQPSASQYVFPLYFNQSLKTTILLNRVT